uniref:Uncharacterized protein n=1 Tax=Arundo donax TaxID=35708 RepID=A0A0A9LFY7_ARUDO
MDLFYYCQQVFLNTPLK